MERRKELIDFLIGELKFKEKNFGSILANKQLVLSTSDMDWDNCFTEVQRNAVYNTRIFIFNEDMRIDLDFGNDCWETVYQGKIITPFEVFTVFDLIGIWDKIEFSKQVLEESKMEEFIASDRYGEFEQSQIEKGPLKNMENGEITS